MMKRNLGRKAAALLLLLCTLFSLVPNVSAESLNDGIARTVTIKMNEKFSLMRTTDGNSLNGYAWEYTTDTGFSGPAFCINWGLKNPPADKKLTIAGKYTASPKTMAAFANGYPQFERLDFVKTHIEAHPIIADLTREEYASATQIAVWATMGQIIVPGTSFTTGRATLALPDDGNIEQMRTYEALKAI